MRRTKHQLCSKLPRRGQPERRRGFLIRNGIVMLEISTKALGLKCSPNGELMHTVGMLRPIAKAIGIRGVLLLELGNGRLVLVEKNSTVSATEAVQLRTSGVVKALWTDFIEEDLFDDVPESFVAGLEKEDGTSGLRVEG